MLKPLVILAVFVVLAGSVSCQPNKTRSNKDHLASKQQPAAAPIAANSDDHCCYSQQTPGDSNDKSFEWHTAVKRSEWWLVVLGFGTLIVVGWQTKTLGRSVAAAQKSADAAETSAIAAMGVAVPTLMLYEFTFVTKGCKDAAEFFRCPKVGISVKNYGQSPAILKSYAIVLTYDGLPPKPRFKFPYPCDTEDTIDAGRIQVLSGKPIEADSITPDLDVLALVDGKKTIIAFGYVCYGDIFGSPFRYMKFCKELVEFDIGPN